MLVRRLQKEMVPRKIGIASVFVWKVLPQSLLLLVFLVAAPAHLAAQPAETEMPAVSETQSAEATAEALAADARALYESGQYAQAITAYVKAHRLAPAGALLYNIAFIYDAKLNEKELALDFYRRFIRSPDADPALMERANQRIAELKVESVGGGTTTQAIGESGTSRVIDPAVTVSVTPESKETTVRPMAIAGWVLTGVGFAAAATGVVFGVLAQDTHDDFKAADSLDDKLDLSDTGEMQALTGDIMMGVGGAALVTGIVLLIVDATSGPSGDTASTGSSYRVGTTMIRGETWTPVFTFGGTL
ncbi:MAG: hypothetical protein HUU55_13965 [Myxococcales bacterium]|nr:hypothetical protein [Myxococcales bacterium]